MSDESKQGPKNPGNPSRPPVRRPERLPSGGWTALPGINTAHGNDASIDEFEDVDMELLEVEPLPFEDSLPDDAFDLAMDASLPPPIPQRAQEDIELADLHLEPVQQGEVDPGQRTSYGVHSASRIVAGDGAPSESPEGNPGLSRVNFGVVGTKLAAAQTDDVPNDPVSFQSDRARPAPRYRIPSGTLGMREFDRREDREAPTAPPVSTPAVPRVTPAPEISAAPEVEVAEQEELDWSTLDDANQRQTAEFDLPPSHEEGGLDATEEASRPPVELDLDGDDVWVSPTPVAGTELPASSAADDTVIPGMAASTPVSIEVAPEVGAQLTAEPSPTPDTNSEAPVATPSSRLPIATSGEWEAAFDTPDSSPTTPVAPASSIELDPGFAEQAVATAQANEDAEQAASAAPAVEQTSFATPVAASPTVRWRASETGPATTASASLEQADDAALPPGSPTLPMAPLGLHDSTSDTAPVAILSEPISAAVVPPQVAATEAPTPALAPVVARTTGAPAAVEAPTTRPVVSVPPLEGGVPQGTHTWLTRLEIFRTFTQGLARMSRWAQLAGVTAYAAMHAPWADGAARTTVLLDLARLYRDRLQDPAHADEAFGAVLASDPGNAEALRYRLDAAAQRGDWQTLFSVHLQAMEATWDPSERLQHAQQAQEIAQRRLKQPLLASRVWRHLWKLGDTSPEVELALATSLRQAGAWDELAALLEERAAALPDGRPLLREALAVRIDALSDFDGAAKLLSTLQDGQAPDPTLRNARLQVASASSDWNSLEVLAKEGDQAWVFRIADVLWEHGQVARAAALYQRFGDAAMADAAVRERLDVAWEQSTDAPGRLAWYIGRAQREENLAAQARWFGRAAEVARDACGDLAAARDLVLRQQAVQGETGQTWEALAQLAAAAGDLDGEIEARTGALRVANSAAAAVECLRALAALHAARPDGEEESLSCLREVLVVDATAGDARENLVAHLKSQQDWAGADRLLTQALDVVTDANALLGPAKQRASNRDAGTMEAPLRRAAWLAVLDGDARDESAVTALTALAVDAEDWVAADLWHEEVARQAPTPAAARSAWLHLLRTALDGGRLPTARLAAEALLRVAPCDGEVVDAALAVYQRAGLAWAAATVIENAAARTPDPQARAAWLTRLADLLPESDTGGRLAVAFRCLELAPSPAADAAMLALAGTPEHGELWASVLASRIVGAAVPAVAIESWAAFVETQLSAPSRGWLIRQAQLLDSTRSPEVVDQLRRHAQANERIEDLLMVLEAASWAQPDGDLRRGLIVEIARRLADDFGDASRAFAVWLRLLRADSQDLEALSAIEALAAGSGMWGLLDMSLASLADRTDDEATRDALLERRLAIVESEAPDPEAAVRLRMLQARLRSDGATVGGDALLAPWDLLVPIREAAVVVHAAEGEDAAAALAGLSIEWSDRLGEHTRGVWLAGRAVCLAPSHAESATALATCLTRTPRLGLASVVLRRAAATTQDSTVAATHLRAALARLDDAAPERADILRRLALLDARDVAAREALADRFRQGGEPWLLRRVLGELLAISTTPETERALRIEMAQVSLSPLRDPVAAWQHALAVLDAHPDDAVAFALLGVAATLSGSPELRAMELERRINASIGDVRAEKAALVSLYVDALDRREDAVAVLKTLVDDEGPDGPAAHRLASLLRPGVDDALQMQLLLQHAQKQPSAATLSAAAAAPGFPALPATTQREVLTDLVTHAPTLVNETRLTAALFAQGDRAAWFNRVGDLGVGASPELQDLLARVRVRMLSPDEPEAWRGLAARAGASASTRRMVALRLASMASAAEDWAGYIQHRRAALADTSAELAAATYCHLAEVVDEHAVSGLDVADFYREARRLDASLLPAMEALKAIGRRVRALRPAAALLPEEGERTMSFHERAARLAALADAATDPVARLDFLRRAVVTDPDGVENWEALASALESAGQDVAAWDAWLQAREATERAQPADGGALDAEAVSLLTAATHPGAPPAMAAACVSLAHRLAPLLPAVALDQVGRLLDDGQGEQATALVDATLAASPGLTAQQRGQLQWRGAQGALLLQQSSSAQSRLDAALRADPLCAPALALRAGLAAAHAPADAVYDYLRAAAFGVEAHHRAEVYRDLARLLEQSGLLPEEVGACAEQAVQAGCTEPNVLRRVLARYERTGRDTLALALFDLLIESASTPEETADLWAVRGRILLSSHAPEDAAVEAFDMALSYDPSCTAARLGLADVFERRGDLEQLAQMLELIAETGTEQERAATLTRLGRIAWETLGDANRARAALVQANELVPQRDAVLLLESIVRQQAPGSPEHLLRLGQLVTFGPPWYAGCIAVGEAVLDSEPRRAWALLAPMLMIRTAEEGLRNRLREMRRDYERPPVLVMPDSVRALQPASPLWAALRPVLAEIERLVPLGATTAEALSAGDLSEVSLHSSIGRTFTALLDAASLDSVSPMRATELDGPVRLLQATAGLKVLIRADIFQQMARAEIGFVLAYAAELCRWGHRSLAAVTANGRVGVVQAVWQALGFVSTDDARVGTRAEQIVSAAGSAALARWRATLEPFAALAPAVVAQEAWRHAHGAGLRAGFVAGPDLYQIARLIARMEGDNERPGIFTSPEHFDEAVAAAPDLQQVVSFAASPAFGQALHEARELGAS